MPSDELYRELKILERKIQLLVGENKNLKSELGEARQSVDKLKNQVKNHQESLSDFQNQIKMNKLANSMIIDSGETSKLRNELDGYIKEIDKCIAHLAS